MKTGMKILCTLLLIFVLQVQTGLCRKISGVLIDQDGAPLAGITIEFQVLLTITTTQTLADGSRKIPK